MDDAENHCRAVSDTPQNITLHIKNIYQDGELEENATCKQFLQVQTEGSREVRREQKFYNFDMILAIGYRVRNNIGICSTHNRCAAAGEIPAAGFIFVIFLRNLLTVYK